ncbi:MAG: SPOR domain-containing protein [Gammaproteobacteria bacterium]
MDPLLKQRMVGTAVLVGLAVIFVPMILDGPVEQNAEPAHSVGMPLELPAQPEEATPGAIEPPASTPTDAPVESAPPETEAGAGWAVQLGSFSAAGNAEALARKVSDAGFAAFVQRVQVDNGTMYRVRIGPLVDRDAATALAARVTRTTEERAVVVPHP